MTEAVVENYETTTRGSASMAAYRAVRILQLLSENTGEDKALLSDELVELLAHPDDPARMPISAARRSIYTSISALPHAGYEIAHNRGVGYRLLTRPLADEEIIRLHGMVMRNLSTPIAIRKSMAQHLVAMASAEDVYKRQVLSESTTIFSETFTLRTSTAAATTVCAT